MDFPSSYQNWDSTNPIELFDAPVVSIPESKGGIIKHLEREASGMDYLVLWLDCDREGENICFEVSVKFILFIYLFCLYFNSISL